MNFNQTALRTQAQSKRLIPTPNPRHPLSAFGFTNRPDSRLPAARRITIKLKQTMSVIISKPTHPTGRLKRSNQHAPTRLYRTRF